MSSDRRHEFIDYEPFVVKQVEKTCAPEGGEGDNWYCYIVKGGRSTITGYSQGSHWQVMQHAEAFVEGLNARASGRAGSLWALRKKK